MKTKQFYTLGVLTLLILGLPHLAQGQIYVDASAPLAGANGQSWATAFPALDQALAVASVGDEVWVAEGFYRPRTQLIPGDVRSVSFDIPSGVEIYGGFDGTEVALDQRAGLFSTTILSGEIGSPLPMDNAYHVLTMENNFFGNIVDGFVIEDGVAYGAPDQNGGAARSFNSNFSWYRNVTFRNNQAVNGGALYTTLTNIYTSWCTFEGNSATEDGGATFQRVGEHWSSNCTYLNNGARGRGGAVFFQNGPGSNELLNCIFAGNISALNGGAIFVARGVQLTSTTSLPGGDVRVTNCTVYGNVSLLGAGGGLWANESAPVPPTIEINNSIFRKNLDSTPATSDNQIGGVIQVAFCNVQGGYAGIGNITANPQFVNAAANDFRLMSISPCRNNGNNLLLLNDLLDVDMDGNFVEALPLDSYRQVRVQQGIVDIGAAETFLDDAGGGKGVRQ